MKIPDTLEPLFNDEVFYLYIAYEDVIKLKIASLKVYEGNNIKRKKRLIRVCLEGASDSEIKKYIKAYIRVCFLLNYEEKLIDAENTENLWNVWVTYTNEELSIYILSNILYNLENPEVITEKAANLVKEGFLYDIAQNFRRRKLPVIEINEDLFQLGYGKNSIVMGADFQSYENLTKVELSRNRKSLWQFLRYSHIPKVEGKVVYSMEEIKDMEKLKYPVNIRSISKKNDVNITVNSEQELNRVLENMLKMYTRAFIYSGNINYRIICFKGKVKLILKKEEEYKVIEVTEKKLEVLEVVEAVENLKKFCSKVYKSIPIEFMYIDLEENEELKVVDLGCVFDIGEELKNIKGKVVDCFVDCLIKEGIGLIPIISVTGTNGKTTTARLINHILNKLGFKCAITSTGGIYLGDKKIKNGDTTGFLSAREVLTNIETDVCVMETARGGIYKNGLGYENAAAAVITSISEEHIGMEGVKNLTDLLNIKTVILDEILPEGKIIVKCQRELLDYVKDRKNVCLFSLDKNEHIKEHINKNGEAFYLEEEYIIWNKDGEEKKLVDIKDIPFTHGGYSKGNILDIMAALSSVTAIYDDINNVISILKTLQCDLYFNPGRQNILDFEGFKVILDYGHNSEAFHEVFSIAKSLKPSKLTAIIAAAGDRMDKYIKELGTIAADYCDYIIIREQADLRGRKKGESASIIEEGVLESQFDKKNLEIIYKEEDALLHAMERAADGEVIVLFTQCLDVIIPVINNFLESRGKKPIAEDLNFWH